MEPSLPKVHSFKNYFGSGLDQRREYFVSVDPKFQELESILFSRYPEIENQRLIYMPEMLEASFYLDGSDFYHLETHEGLNYTGQCHLISYELYKAAGPNDRVEIYHGFYLIDNLWRPHSWVDMNSMFIDGTGNKSIVAYGRKIDPVTFEGRVL